MRRTTRKYILLLMGVLAVAGLVESRRLNDRLAEAKQDLYDLQEQHRLTLRQLRQAQQTPVNAVTPMPPEAAINAGEREYYQRRMQRLEERIAFLETAAITIRAGGETPPIPLDPTEYSPAAAAAYDALLPILTNPELREVLRMRIEATLERTHLPLLAYFDFDAESEDVLLALLLEQHWNALNYRLIDLHADLDPELREYTLESLNADRDDLNAVLYNFLGPENYEVYQAYELTQPERQQLANLQQTLSRREIPLTEAQENELIILMHEENTALDEFTLTEFTDNDDPMPPNEIMEAYRDASADHYQRILERAANVLTPDQMTYFQAFAATQRALQEATIRQLLEAQR